MREHQEKTRVAKVTIKGAFTAHRVMRFGCPASIKAGLLVLVCATLFCCIRAIEPKSACVDIIARVGHNAKPAMTTLHDAAWNNDLQSASLLLKSGTDVNEKDWCALLRSMDAPMPLICQCKRCCLILCHSFFRLGYSALLKVATRGYLEMARVLLDHGAEVNAKIREYCCCRFLGFILPNNECFRGYTALDDAIYANHDEIADLLLLRGVSLAACASSCVIGLD